MADIRRVHRTKSNDQDPYITYSSSKLLDNDKKKKLNTSNTSSNGSELSSNARIVKKKTDNVKSRIDYPSPNSKYYSNKDVYTSTSIRDKDATNKRSLNTKSYNRKRSFSRSNSRSPTRSMSASPSKSRSKSRSLSETSRNSRSRNRVDDTKRDKSKSKKSALVSTSKSYSKSRNSPPSAKTSHRDYSPANSINSDSSILNDKKSKSKDKQKTREKEKDKDKDAKDKTKKKSDKLNVSSDATKDSAKSSKLKGAKEKEKSKYGNEKSSKPDSKKTSLDKKKKRPSKSLSRSPSPNNYDYKNSSYNNSYDNYGYYGNKSRSRTRSKSRSRSRSRSRGSSLLNENHNDYPFHGDRSRPSYFGRRGGSPNYGAHPKSKMFTAQMQRRNNFTHDMDMPNDDGGYMDYPTYNNGRFRPPPYGGRFGAPMGHNMPPDPYGMPNSNRNQFYPPPHGYMNQPKYMPNSKYKGRYYQPGAPPGIPPHPMQMSPDDPSANPPPYSYGPPHRYNNPSNYYMNSKYNDQYHSYPPHPNAAYNSNNMYNPNKQPFSKMDPKQQSKQSGDAKNDSSSLNSSASNDDSKLETSNTEQLPVEPRSPLIEIDSELTNAVAEITEAIASASASGKELTLTQEQQLILQKHQNLVQQQHQQQLRHQQQQQQLNQANAQAKKQPNYRLLGRNIFDTGVKQQFFKKRIKANTYYSRFIKQHPTVNLPLAFQKSVSLAEDKALEEKEKQMSDDQKNDLEKSKENRKASRSSSRSSSASSSSSHSSTSSSSSSVDSKGSQKIKKKKKKKANKKSSSSKKYQFDLNEQNQNEYDSDGSMLDLRENLKPIGAYIKDRERMLDEMFRCIKGKKLQAMFPDILKNKSFKEIRARCLEVLDIMSKKRIGCLLADKQMVSSSGTESSEDEDDYSDGAYETKNKNEETSKFKPIGLDTVQQSNSFSKISPSVPRLKPNLAENKFSNLQKEDEDSNNPNSVENETNKEESENQSLENHLDSNNATNQSTSSQNSIAAAGFIKKGFIKKGISIKIKGTNDQIPNEPGEKEDLKQKTQKKLAYETAQQQQQATNIKQNKNELASNEADKNKMSLQAQLQDDKYNTFLNNPSAQHQHAMHMQKDPRSQMYPNAYPMNQQPIPGAAQINLQNPNPYIPNPPSSFAYPPPPLDARMMSQLPKQENMNFSYPPHHHHNMHHPHNPQLPPHHVMPNANYPPYINNNIPQHSYGYESIKSNPNYPVDKTGKGYYPNNNTEEDDYGAGFNINDDDAYDLDDNPDLSDFETSNKRHDADYDIDYDFELDNIDDIISTNKSNKKNKKSTNKNSQESSSNKSKVEKKAHKKKSKKHDRKNYNDDDDEDTEEGLASIKSSLRSFIETHLNNLDQDNDEVIVNTLRILLEQINEDDGSLALEDLYGIHEQIKNMLEKDEDENSMANSDDDDDDGEYKSKKKRKRSNPKDDQRMDKLGKEKLSLDGSKNNDDELKSSKKKRRHTANNSNELSDSSHQGTDKKKKKNKSDYINIDEKFSHTNQMAEVEAGEIDDVYDDELIVEKEFEELLK